MSGVPRGGTRSFCQRRGETLLEGPSPSGNARRQPLADARLTRAALAAAGSRPDLDAALREAAEILCERFSADHASYFVHYGDHRPHVAAAGNLPMDEAWLMRWVSAPDHDYQSGVARDDMPIIDDVGAIQRSPAQEDSYQKGARSGMRVPLHDEKGAMLGLVSLGSRRLRAFDTAQLDELRELAALSAAFIRRALLLEEMQLERDLLAEEAALLAGLADLKTHTEAMQLAAERIHAATRSRRTVILARPLDSDELTPVVSPAGVLSPEQWRGLEAAAREPGNTPLLKPPDGNVYWNHSLVDEASTPVEAWLRDELNERAVLVSSGRITESRRFVVAVTRNKAERWEASTIAFVSRVTRMLELNIERQRTESLAQQQSERLASQARLLTALDPTRPLQEIAGTFAEEIRRRHEVECLAIVRWPKERSEPDVLYRSPRLDGFPAGIATPSRETAGGGAPQVQFHELGANALPRELEEGLLQIGIRRVARIPLAVRGETAGFVSVTWEDSADAGERLAELEHAVRPLALVIERAELLADIEQQRQTLEVSADILASLATATEVEEACELIAGRLRRFFDADHVVAATLNFDAGTRHVLGFDSDVVSRSQLPVVMEEADRQAYLVAVEAGCEVLPDLVELDLNPGTEIARKAGLRSLIRASFALADGEVGLVSVASRRANAYRREDAAQLLGFCRPIGLAIDRMQLIADMAATTEVLTAQTRVLASLGPGATTESAGEVLVAEARRLFGATHAAITVTVDNNTKTVALSSDHLCADDLRFRDPEHHTVRITYKSLMEGNAQLLPNLALERSGEVEERAFRGGLRTLMRAPIFSTSGQVIGAMSIGSAHAYAWGERELKVLTELSSALGLVVARAELFEAAEERKAKASALTRLLSTFNVDAPPDEVARLFAAEVRRFLAADSVLVMSFDHETDSRTVVANVTTLDGPRIVERNSLARSTSYQGMLESPASLYDGSTPEKAPPWLRETATALGLGSIIAVRLDAESIPVGLIAAGCREPGRLGEGELTILSEVAAPLAMLLERARVLTSLHRQTERTQAVLDILAALGPRDTVTEVAQPVAEAVRAMYGVEHCGVNALDGNNFVLAGIDSTLADWQPGTIVTPSAIFEKLVHEGFDLDYTGDDETTAVSAIDELLRARGMKSSLRVLIGRREEPLGFVRVGSTSARRFTEADARELAQIVQPLGVVVSYFRDKRQAEQRTMKLEYTNRILTRLSAGGTAEHMAAGFLSECRVLFGSSHGVALYFHPDEGSASLLSADSTVLDTSLLPPSVPLHWVQSGRLLTQPTPHVIHDIREQPLAGDVHARLVNAGLHSCIHAPLIVQDKVRGAVSLWAEGPGRFTNEDADLLGTLTRPFALALEKASALESLGESELKYRSLVAQAEEMIFQFDSATGAILDANAHTARSLGYTAKELLTLRLGDIMDSPEEEIAEHVQATLADGEVHLVDRHFLRKDGTRFDVDLVASLVSYGRRQAILVLARDVSERKAFQRQLVQGQKMEALGTMAGHVAHDFNNLLTTILGFAGLLKRSRNLDSEERENLGLIEDAARRAADLTGHLLAFARGGLVRFGPIDLRTVVTDTMRLAEPSLHAALETSVTLPDMPVMVEGDGGQLQHAVFNIVSNARDAMPEGGTIDIALRTDGVTATVSITDNGPGMDDETRTRIFEPFYTTKPVGTGTGLGMAITYGIIQGHHGDITVDSKKGRGTTFAITLPLLPGGSHSAAIDAFNAGEGNLVLVVDDDEMVRRTTSATLAALGYNVVEAPGGATAVEIVRARPERFSVVLLDLVMPGMTGSETFRALTAIRPDLPVVVCTGYAADAHIDMDVKRRIAGLVQKPFTGERLQRALDAAGALPTRVVTQ